MYVFYAAHIYLALMTRSSSPDVPSGTYILRVDAHDHQFDNVGSFQFLLLPIHPNLLSI